MTNEKAIEVIRENCYIFNPMNLDRTTLVNTALDKARKALEAEDVLDKIRPEIYQKQYDFMSDGDYNEGIRFGLMLAYQIINNYMAESEDKVVQRWR